MDTQGYSICEATRADVTAKPKTNRTRRTKSMSSRQTIKHPPSNEKLAYYTFIFRLDFYERCHSRRGVLALIFGRFEAFDAVRSYLRVEISGINREEASLCRGTGRTYDCPESTLKLRVDTKALVLNDESSVSIHRQAEDRVPNGRTSHPYTHASDTYEYSMSVNNQ